MGANVKDQAVVQDKNWITSRNPNDLRQFSEAALNALGNLVQESWGSRKVGIGYPLRRDAPRHRHRDVHRTFQRLINDTVTPGQPDKHGSTVGWDAIPAHSDHSPVSISNTADGTAQLTE